MSTVAVVVASASVRAPVVLPCCDVVAYAILAAFVVLTLLLVFLGQPRTWIRRASALSLSSTSSASRRLHFVLTPILYLQSNNLRYFNGSWRNRLIYFAIPIAIFLFFDLYATLQVAVLFPIVALLVRTGIRVLDFRHFSSQTFGVLQMYKARGGCKFPSWVKRVENQYYFALSLLLLTTFIRGGRWMPDNLAAIVLSLTVAGLFAVLVVGFALATLRSGNGREVLLPLAYFLFQTGAALLAVYNLAFYGLALAMHYVEYHLLMGAGCFRNDLDLAKPVDRVFGILRANKFIFYSLLVFVAFVVTACTADFSAMLTMIEGRCDDGRPGSRCSGPRRFCCSRCSTGCSCSTTSWNRLSGALRSELYYRQTLGPLYFAPRPAASPPA